VALADEIAAAADLARGKADGVPAVIVRGLDAAGDGAARDLVMPPERDLFR
jgi:coenzyme F420-0:L-glutamate ligase/coenzyme F420-1:gamma-L-glutamate ligase